MPVPNPGSKVGFDTLKVKFLMISGRPKTRFFGQISGAPGYIPPIPASYQPRSACLVAVLGCQVACLLCLWPGLVTEKPELHEVPGHSCNSGAQKSPKTTPREPPGNSTPEAHEPAK